MRIIANMKIAITILSIALAISLLSIVIVSNATNKLEERLAKANQNISTLNSALSSTTEAKNDISKKLESANQTIADQKNTISDLRNQVNSLNKQLTTLKSSSQVKTPTNTQTESSNPYKSATFSINGSYEVVDDNHVGDEWSCNYSISGDGLYLNNTLAASVGDVIKISVTATEKDNSPDIGRNSITRTLSYNDIVHGFSTTLTVYVKEDNGRYSGNTATIRVNLTFTPK